MKKFKIFAVIWCAVFVLFNVVVFCLPALLGEAPFFRQAGTGSFDAWTSYGLFASAFLCPLATMFLERLLGYESEIRFWFDMPMNAVCYASMGLTLAVGGLCLLCDLNAGLSLLVAAVAVLPLFRLFPLQPKERVLPKRDYEIYNLSDEDWVRRYMIDYIKEGEKPDLPLLKELEETPPGALPEDLLERCVKLLESEEKEDYVTRKEVKEYLTGTEGHAASDIVEMESFISNMPGDENWMVSVVLKGDKGHYSYYYDREQDKVLLESYNPD